MKHRDCNNCMQSDKRKNQAARINENVVRGREWGMGLVGGGGGGLGRERERERERE